MSDLYRELILDHYRSPRNHGELDPCDAHAQGTNPLCGDDDVAITVNFDDDAISEIRFQGRGCAISQASASILTEIVEGRTVGEVAELQKEELLEELGAPIAKNPARADREGITLADLFKMFPDDAAAERWYEEQRWPDGNREWPGLRLHPTLGHEDAEADAVQVP